MKLKISIIWICFFGTANFLQAQADSSITMTYAEGKDRLLKQSLIVLSEFYNINLAEAEVEQAKLWNNPMFVWNAEMYSVDQNKYFKFVNQKLIQVEYVINVSGKRIKAVRKANLEVEISKNAFKDVVRGLMYEFSISFTNLWSLREKSKIYEEVKEQYENQLRSFEKQFELGVISLNDLVRIRAELVLLNNEITLNSNEIISEQSNINTMLNLSPNIKIIPIEREKAKTDTLNLALLLDAAKSNRPDWMIAQKNIGLYEAELVSQKSQSIPDINLGYQPHDKGSNHVRPYVGMVMEFDIPIFNRNQGQISKAKIQIEQSKLQLDVVKREMENDVVSSYLQYVNFNENFVGYSDDFMKQIDELSDNAAMNFDKKNISMIEYIDYRQSYLNIQMQYIDLMNHYLQSVNNLNFSVGKEITN